MELPNRPPRVGQRWMWSVSGARYVVQVTSVDPYSVEGIVIQIIDRSAYSLGYKISPTIHSQALWILLEGQDAPRDGT
jgi:hypothetical protein